MGRRTRRLQEKAWVSGYLESQWPSDSPFWCLIPARLPIPGSSLLEILSQPLINFQFVCMMFCYRFLISACVISSSALKRHANTQGSLLGWRQHSGPSLSGRWHTLGGMKRASLSLLYKEITALRGMIQLEGITITRETTNTIIRSAAPALWPPSHLCTHSLIELHQGVLSPVTLPLPSPSHSCRLRSLPGCIQEVQCVPYFDNAFDKLANLTLLHLATSIEWNVLSYVVRPFSLCHRMNYVSLKFTVEIHNYFRRYSHLYLESEG